MFSLAQDCRLSSEDWTGSLLYHSDTCTCISSYCSYRKRSTPGNVDLLCHHTSVSMPMQKQAQGSVGEGADSSSCCRLGAASKATAMQDRDMHGRDKTRTSQSPSMRVITRHRKILHGTRDCMTSTGVVSFVSVCTNVHRVSNTGNRWGKYRI